jgi:hypothetical protein
MARNKTTKQADRTTSRTVVLEREIKSLKKQLEKETSLYKKTRKKLSGAYHSLMELVERLANIKVHGTKKEIDLKQRIKAGREENVRLTNVRDEYQMRIDALNVRITKLGTELTVLREQEINETKNIDDIVIQVFELNRTVVQAATAREDCLRRHVFPRLVDVDGNLSSQITFASSDGLRKVVAMVNTMTIIRGDLAREAQAEIKRFISRVQSPVLVEPSFAALLDLTRQLLIEKTDFKVGPNLYRFLAIEIDPYIFPELARAQTLLRQSIRSEKTNSYIRIYERTSRNDPWEVVPQS